MLSWVETDLIQARPSLLLFVGLIKTWPPLFQIHLGLILGYKNKKKKKKTYCSYIQCWAKSPVLLHRPKNVTLGFKFLSQSTGLVLLAIVSCNPTFLQMNYWKKKKKKKKKSYRSSKS